MNCETCGQPMRLVKRTLKSEQWNCRKCSRSIVQDPTKEYNTNKKFPIGYNKTQA